MYCVSDTAVVKFIKRLDYSPLCFCTFVCGWYWGKSPKQNNLLLHSCEFRGHLSLFPEPNTRLIITVITDSGTLLIYEDANLKWAAQLTEVPIAIDRSNVDGLPGALVTLGRTGRLQVSYLGSEPLLFKVPPLNLNTLNFAKTQQELTELEKEIKAGVDFTDMSLVNNAAEHDISVRVKISTKLEQCSNDINTRDRPMENDNNKMCTVCVGLKAAVPLEQVQVQFYVESPLMCSEKSRLYENIGAESIEQFDTNVYFADNLLASSAKVSVVVSFINKKCIPRVIRKSEVLPLDMFCKPASPQKEAAHKITITVENGEAPTAEGLFPEFTADLSTNGVVGFKMFHSDAIVTVVSARNSNRYRYFEHEINYHIR